MNQNMFLLEMICLKMVCKADLTVYGRLRWLSWMHVWLVIRSLPVQTPPGRQHSFVETDHEIFSTDFLSLPLIQEGQLSVSGKRMCTVLVNYKACPVKVCLGKLTTHDRTPLGCLGHKSSTQNQPYMILKLCRCTVSFLFDYHIMLFSHNAPHCKA